MSDFNSEFPPLEDFSTPNKNASLESDPTADFLAREQAILGADADLFANSNHTITSTTSNELEGFPDITSITSPSANNVLSPPVSNISNNSVSDYSAFHSEFPSVEIENTQASYNIEEEEPEVIRQWRERQREIIAQRDETSEAKKRETLSIARDAIDKFYEEYNEKKARTQKQNKQDEETFLRERDDLTSGTSWERICKQVDLSTAQSKTTNKHVKDVSRFKEMLLSLKKDEKAPGAGGY
ncbi:clathrin light chain [Glomus cerebriforme]|uniref:Clathrin light chain n=1 Tax=Glomus cerebriforme TaxID=658196 RepID=A0A397S8E2_9GLOM|nr:clathrin light chain [Glomus cerebriforme]RIA79001.1 clathrin light chain [Glomus cerebriforme]